MSTCKYCGKEDAGHVDVGMVVIPSCVTQLIAELRAQLAVNDAKIEEACAGSKPSAGYTWTDEVIGLLRATRSQRDTTEAQLVKLTQPVTQAQPADKNLPRRFRWPLQDGKHPNGSTSEWRYGLYFPQTDLCVGDMGNRATGVPNFSGVEWIDTKPDWA